MSDEREQLAAAQARIAQLERESEVNRAFFNRALAQANEPLAKASGPRLSHVLSLLIGVALGVLATVALVVAREPPPPVPLPPQRAAVPATVVVDAGTRTTGSAETPPPLVAAPRPALEPAKPPPAPPPDDTGALNLLSTSAAIVYVDGRKIGPTPQRGVPFKPGEHWVKFVCSGDAGVESQPHRVIVPPFAEVDVEHQCE